VAAHAPGWPECRGRQRLTRHPQVPSASGHWEIYDTPEPQDDAFTLGSLKIEWQTEHFLVTSATAGWTRTTLVSQDGTEENDGPSGLGSLGTASPYDTSAGGLGPTGPGPTGPGVQEKDNTRQLSEELRLTSTDPGSVSVAGGLLLPASAIRMVDVVHQSAGRFGRHRQHLRRRHAPDHHAERAVRRGLDGVRRRLEGDGGTARLSLRLHQSNTEWGDFTPYGFANLLSGAPTLAGNTAPFNTASSGSASGVNPKFDLSWKVDPQLLLYATVARGFRMGGTDQPFTGYLTTVSAASCAAPSSLAVILQCGLQSKLSSTASIAGGYYAPNVQFPNATAQGVPQFKSDSVWNYELGEKGEFFDRQFTLNADVYYERWNSPQLATNVSGFGYTVNGADASILGTEIEMWLKLPAGFSLAANLGYADTKFLSDSAITGYLSGTAIPDFAEGHSSVTLRNVTPLSGGRELISSLSYNYIGERTNALTARRSRSTT
jgi:hypothetical protein